MYNDITAVKPKSFAEGTMMKINYDANTYKHVFDISPDFMSVSRLSDGTYLDVNEGYLKFTGYKKHEVIGKTSVELNIWVYKEQRQNFINTLLKYGKLQGFEMQLKNKNGEIRDIEASATISMIGNEKILISIARDITERKKLEQKLHEYNTNLEELVNIRTQHLQYLANHDALTGLPNRLFLVEKIEKSILNAKSTRSYSAMLNLDLDKFKPVNDVYGHDVGDELLKQVSKRLKQIVRKTDTISRVGGDEFIIVLENIYDIKDVKHVSSSILKCLSENFIINGHTVNIGGSIGIALYPDDATDIKTLMKNADVAMYHSKRAGRNCYRFYEEK